MTIYTNNLSSVYTPLQFTEVPSIQTLACKPIIEQVQVSVIIARSSAQVLDFKLLGEPQPRSDAWKLGVSNVVQPSDLYGRPSYQLQKRTNYIVEMGQVFLVFIARIPAWPLLTAFRFGTYFMTQLVKGASIALIGTEDSDVSSL
jgi:hypothetical protein